MRMFRFVYQHFSFHLIPLLLLEFFDWVCLSKLFWNPLLKREYLVINSLVMLRTRLSANPLFYDFVGFAYLLWAKYFATLILTTTTDMLQWQCIVICLNGDDEWFYGDEDMNSMRIVWRWLEALKRYSLRLFTLLNTPIQLLETVGDNWVSTIESWNS